MVTPIIHHSMVTIELEESIAKLVFFTTTLQQMLPSKMQRLNALQEIQMPNSHDELKI
jgi:hypothetical protein